MSDFREEEEATPTPSSTATGNAGRSSKAAAAAAAASEVVITVNGNPYKVLKQIGKGGSSVVFQVLDEEKNLKAIKRVDLSRAEESEAEGYLNEVR